MRRSSITPDLGALVNRRVSLAISEPWEFATGLGAEPLFGRITEIRREFRASSLGLREAEMAVVQVERPFAHCNLKCEYLLASPRHEGFGLADLESNEVVTFNLSRISTEQASSDDPFDLTRWRAQPTFGLIGTIRPEPR